VEDLKREVTMPLKPIESWIALLPVLAMTAAPLAATVKTPPPYDIDLYSKRRETVSSHLEFLYWTVEESALDYVQKMQQAAPAASAYYAIGDIDSASFQMSPGLRLRASYFNAPKYWECWLQYTLFSSQGKSSASKPKSSDRFLTGTWPQIIPSYLVHAHSSINFVYNLLDIMVDRMFIPNPHLRLRMAAGIGTAWIKQNWSVHYFDSLQNSTAIRNRWHYVGAGMKIGLMGDWFWGNDIYLTGFSTTGLYIGRYHNGSKQTISTQSLPVRDSDFTDTRPAFMAQFSLGPSWQKSYCGKRFELFAGYETSIWCNLQESRRSSNGSSAYDEKQSWIASSIFALQGLTTRFTVDF
jgi:hypothetical protein